MKRISLRRSIRVFFTRTRAFSLIEISLSLAVFAFCILSIVAILSVALDTFRESQRESNITCLIRCIDGEVRSAYDTATVTALSSTNRFYDITGKAVTNAADIYFTVKLTPVATASVGSTFTLERSTNVNMWSARITSPPTNSAPVYVLFGSTRPDL